MTSRFYAFQDINDIPGILPEGRTKPWGTGQAVLAAKNVLDAPFVVINMLDGREEFEGDLKKICLQAALIRVYLCSVLTEQKINIGKYYVKYRAILPWIQEIEDADSDYDDMHDVFQHVDGEQKQQPRARETSFSNMHDVFQYVEEREKLRKYAFTLRSIFKKQIDIPINIGNR